MTEAVETPLRQRSDYTHKFNTKSGRHGWLRLTPAYSLKVVEELISKHKAPVRILDPFCGTGTTALSAAYYGHRGVTADINPFLVWFATTKTASYDEVILNSTRLKGAEATRMSKDAECGLADVPPIANHERWWPADALLFLRAHKAAIDAVAVPSSSEHNLLLVAFCRTLIELSNAAFNHQSMSFKQSRQLGLNFGNDYADTYLRDLQFVLDGASQNPEGSSSVFLGDARQLALQDELFDQVVTSPPYANRMSYIRELRPYMYWLEYLTDAPSAGVLDWQAIGGTWGMATSRLKDWKPSPSDFRSEQLESAVAQIGHEDNKNGALLANYVAKYFHDMWDHFQSLIPLLRPGADIHYIVGNSSFYGVLLPVELIYAQMLEALGFEEISCLPIRKRNSKKELVEFDVTAVWPS